MYTLEECHASVGPGWSTLITACYLACEKEDVEISQVKEKFGGLRFYIYPHKECVAMVIEICEELSYKICEVCGKDGEPSTDRYWIKTLCPEHVKEREENREAYIKKYSTGR